MNRYKKIFRVQCVTVEREVKLSDFEDLRLPRIFKSRGWLPAMGPSEPANIQIVREFYANISSFFRRAEKPTWLLKLARPNPNEKSPGFLGLLVDNLDLKLVKSTLGWNKRVRVLREKRLSDLYKVLNSVVRYNIDPPFHVIPSLLSADRALLLYAIGNNVPIDLATYIFCAIYRAAFPASMPDSLPFASLITRFAMASRVPVEPTGKLYSPWSPLDNIWNFGYSFTPSSPAVKQPQAVVIHALGMALLTNDVAEHRGDPTFFRNSHLQGDGRCLKLFLALLILFLQNVKGGEVGHSHNHSHSLRDAKVTVRCIERERQALLAFKRGLVDESNQLSTWGSEAEKQDCCRWEGVYCSNQTGHVIQLDLRHSFPAKMIQLDLGHYLEYPYYLEYPFQGKMISPKLIELQHLQYLDLSFIDFNGIQIPDFIGSLTNLRYLNLSFCYFIGPIPSSFRNLTQLQNLDLAHNWRLQAENLNWLPALSSLTYLDLTWIDFNGSRIPDFIGSLTNLRNLSLSSCNFIGPIPSSFENLTQLQNLDLSDNQLQPENLNCLPALSSLTDLDLSRNFNGSQIPDFIGSLTNLRNLRLRSCHFIGPIPSSFENLTQLQNLDLRDNQLQPENLNCLPALSSLTDLDLSGNFNGSQIPDFIGSLTNLRNLHLSSCPFIGQIPSSFGNLTQLQNLDLSGNQLQPENLNCLPALSSLTDLDLSGSFDGGQIPDFIGSLTNLRYLSLYYCNLVGQIPSSFGNLTQLQHLDLRYNQLQPQNLNWLPAPSSLTYLALSENNLSTVFDWPEAVLNKLPKLVGVDLGEL
ncbi:LRR receptor-like serine/threonine-protein kinase GSO1 [Prunus yedoensis var. nudiflora]|uniref:LRR receptor-like serine/threonine-protein kinase GSO1 n=1 Tax=Prunus yedoensis var. nudiflora TaxID=2094558 RepID=A0A314UR51_PRUYE|nr:LRR receptor-like serine/threonine-protein kinase GSO1 [Prunus yedoensis var. nudiflora]